MSTIEINQENYSQFVYPNKLNQSGVEYKITSDIEVEEIKELSVQNKAALFEISDPHIVLYGAKRVINYKGTSIPIIVNINADEVKVDGMTIFGNVTSGVIAAKGNNIILSDVSAYGQAAEKIGNLYVKFSEDRFNWVGDFTHGVVYTKTFQDIYGNSHDPQIEMYVDVRNDTINKFYKVYCAIAKTFEEIYNILNNQDKLLHTLQFNNLYPLPWYFELCHKPLPTEEIVQLCNLIYQQYLTSIFAELRGVAKIQSSEQL